MTDPFWMIMTMQALGDGYIVWDKAATIEFVKPGRGTVVAEFRLDDTVLEQIRAATAGGDKHLHWFETPVRDAGGDTVRSEEHTSELQSLMRISYAVFCLKKKKKLTQQNSDLTN